MTTKTIFPLFSLFVFVGCSNGSKKNKNQSIESTNEFKVQSPSKYIDVSSSKKDVEFYNLKKASINDNNGVEVFFSLPTDWVEAPELREGCLCSYYKVENTQSLYFFSVKTFESKNTAVLSDKDYADTVLKYNPTKESLKASTAQMLPKSIFKDLQIVDADASLIINSKHFMKRVVHYVDTRNNGTLLEGLNVTEFHYATFHEGKKYEFYVVYQGNDKFAGSLVALFNTIAGTIIFD